MGIRYRKAINLGSGVRVNLSKRGVGASVGNKGFRVTKKSGGGMYSTFTAYGTGLSYRTKESSRNKSIHYTENRNSFSTNSDEFIDDVRNRYDVNPSILYKRNILQLKSELKKKERQIESSKLSIILATILQVLLCSLVITIPLALFVQTLKKQHRNKIECLELDILDLKDTLKKTEYDLK